MNSSKFTVTGARGTDLPLTIKQYAGGEYDVTVDFGDASMWDFEEEATIEAHIRDGEIMLLALVVDAVRELLGKRVHIVLHLPYLPYARQDRVTEPGQAFSLKVFTKLLNTLPVDVVLVNDCHSDVGTALMDNVVNLPLEMPRIPEDVDVIIAPDFGATKKARGAARGTGLHVIQAGKMRDAKTGELSDPIIFGSVHGKNVLILDDICDGGRTFLQLGKSLKEAGAEKMYLHVTHGIFSYGAKEKLKEAGYEVTATYDWTEKD